MSDDAEKGGKGTVTVGARFAPEVRERIRAVMEALRRDWVGSEHLVNEGAALRYIVQVGLPLAEEKLGVWRQVAAHDLPKTDARCLRVRAGLGPQPLCTEPAGHYPGTPHRGNGSFADTTWTDAHVGEAREEPGYLPETDE